MATFKTGWRKAQLEHFWHTNGMWNACAPMIEIRQLALLQGQLKKCRANHTRSGSHTKALDKQLGWNRLILHNAHTIRLNILQKHYPNNVLRGSLSRFVGMFGIS